jgi:hypothetical protein
LFLKRLLLNIFLPLVFQFFDFPFDSLSMDHLQGENLHKTNAVEAADEDGGVENLVFYLVGLEELDGAISGRDKKDDGPYPDENCGGAHLWAVEVPCYRPY